MALVFSIGIDSLWDELRHISAGGLGWINCDRYSDAILFVNQTLQVQAPQTKVAVITMSAAPETLISPLPPAPAGPDEVRLFTMPNSQDAFHHLHHDLLCSFEPENYFIVLLCAENAWQGVAPAHIKAWIRKSQSWAQEQRCTLLIINSGAQADRQTSMLMSEYQHLSGLATLRYQGDAWLYDVAFWFNDKGVSARQQLQVTYANGRLALVPRQEVSLQSRSDERRVLSHIAVLEGAPPLSENWTLFESNDALFNEARQAQAATIIFSLTQNNQIEGLARHVHALRRQRGSALKIIVRENKASVRATDERLLLGCGANMVIPWNAPLSRCLTLIESVQNQQFTRFVPEDVNTLLEAMQPLKMRGYQPWDVFCNAVGALMNNVLIPQDNKGILVALRPVPGIRVEQALTLCRPGRMGDIVTLGENRLVLFLSFCRITDLDTALSHIFPLPISELFSNRMVWHEDKQIAAEIFQMSAMRPEQWTAPLAMTRQASQTPAILTDAPKTPVRRTPTPITLLNDPAQERAL
ncbi:cellulose biosynthesis protein BcsE [Cronobacter muytjensii]